MSKSTIRGLQPATTTSIDGVSAGKKLPIKEVAVSIDLSALTGGTPLVDFEVEGSPDGVNYGSADTNADTFAQFTATGVKSKHFTAKAPFHRLAWTIGGNVAEIQAIEHDHTGGNFTLSFDGEGPTAPLEYDAPNNSDFAEGTLTIDTKPVDDIAAVGEMTIAEPVGGIKSGGVLHIDEPVSDNDTMTIDAVVYRFKTTPDTVNDIFIGADEAATKVNIPAAINLTGTEGVEYFAGLAIHPTVSAATAFATDTLDLTAKEFGPDEDAIVTTDTFTHVDNEFTDTTLSTTGASAIDTITVDAQVYRFMEVGVQAYDIFVGADEPATKINIIAAINASGTPGVEYFAGTNAHPTVSAATFIGDDALFSALVAGLAGDSIVTTETFFDG